MATVPAAPNSASSGWANTTRARPNSIVARLAEPAETASGPQRSSQPPGEPAARPPRRNWHDWSSTVGRATLRAQPSWASSRRDPQQARVVLSQHLGRVDGAEPQLEL